MKIKELLFEARVALKKADVENSGFEAELMLTHLLEKDRIFLYTHDQETVSESVEKSYREMIKRRAEHEPTAYLLKEKEFMGLSFYVDSNVLIPRPDTEPMVEYLIDWLKNNFPAGGKVLDLCTGSGAIGIALKYFHPQADITLSDYSKEALQVAEKNGNALVFGKIRLSQGDLFENLKAAGPFNLIVSNPPYIPTDEVQTLAPDIYEYEPVLALDGGRSGLDFYERISSQAMDYLNSGGLLALEVGDHQETAVKAMLEKSGFIEIEEIRDLTGLVRSVIGQKPRES